MFFIQRSQRSPTLPMIQLYSCSPNFEEATLKLSDDTHLIPNWFRINSMVANPGKF